MTYSRSFRLACIVALTLLGAAMRLVNLNAQALRGDEAFTVLHWMREPLSQTVATIATVDPQGPFNYALYRAYALTIGSDPEMVRFLPAMLSIIGVPLLYVLANRFGGGVRVGLIAAALWAISPVAIYHAQDARSYAVWAITSALALWLALRALHEPLRRINWVLYIAAATLALYTYYLELFVVAALNLGVLIWIGAAALRRRPFMPLTWRWFAAQAVIALLILPWYAQPRLLSGGGYTGTTTGFDPRYFIERFIPSLLFGEHPAFHTVGFGVAVIVIIALYTIRMWRMRTVNWLSGPLLPLLLFVVPMLAIILASIRLNIFAPRYILSASVALTLITAHTIVIAVPVSVSRLVTSRWGGCLRDATGFALVLCIGILGYSAWIGAIDYAKSPDWRALSAYLAAQASPDDVVIQAAADEAYTLYCLEYAFTADCDLKLPANPRQSIAEIEAFLTTRSETSRSLWYVAQPPIGWENRTAATDWLRANMQLVRDTGIDRLPVTQYMPFTVRADEIAPQPFATVDDTIALDGIHTDAESHALYVRLIWRPLAQTDSSLKFFVHLVDANGVLLSQDDQFPQDGLLDSQTWSPGEHFRDVFIIPLPTIARTSPDSPAVGLPPGASLAIGLYDPVTLTRLPLADGSDSLRFPLP